MSTLNMCSRNVNGINTPIKQRKVLNYLKREQIHIALLQETHLDSIEHLKLAQGGFGQVFFSSFSSRSRGTAILISRHLPFKPTDCIKDEGGRYVIVRGVLYGEEIAILNIYFPPGHPGDFMITAFTKLVNLNINNSFVGGDFNCHLNPIMDKSPQGSLGLLRQAKTLIALCEELDYVDVWRTQHMVNKEFTFFSKVHSCYTRIDYFFVPNSILSSIMSSSIGNIVISDHAAVLINCKIGNLCPQNKRWHLDSSIFYDQKCITYFIEEFKQFLAINIPSTDNSSLLWETSKAYSRGLITSYTSYKRHRQTEQQKILESKLKLAEENYIKKPSTHKLKEITALCSSLDCLLTKEAEIKIRFARQRLYEHGNKPGKYLAHLTKKKSNSQSISSITDSNGKQFFDSAAINDIFKKFYENLYKPQLHNNPDLIDEFFSSLNLPTLTEEQRSQLDCPISRRELLDAIKELQTGKVAGPDGLIAEFYKEFQEVLAEPLLNMYNDSFEKGILPVSLREANISLILKKGKAPEDCASYRPISLLNVDLKLLSKILARRLECVLPLLINEDQTGFIKGRNSNNNMRRLLNTIQIFNQKSLPGLVVSLDAEKAFDRVEWPYLFSTLRQFGLSENFVKWVMLLYNNPCSAVLTNGLRSPNFHVLRGTRQGCPLSPLLFALAVEPFAEAVRAREDIRGLTIGQRQHKITLYADDVLVVLTQPETSIPSLIETINKFSDISGYKINFNKSEVMPLGILKQKPQTHSSFPFKWSPEGFVYLGIKITPAFDQMYKSNFT
uniref:Reverse transcriptase domain-containing protein n=1 Tax=Poecilia mexicana TaxID=48701 RepID=A0A3B3YI25_9TELE